MPDLLSKIKDNPDLKVAANVLRRAGLQTDSEIRSLTREELHDLFPGPEKLKLRRTIFEIINQPKPVHTLVNELKAFIPHDFLGAAQTGNGGVLNEYLVLLKDLKTQLNQVQVFIDAHIDLLEGRNNDQLNQEHEKVMTAEEMNRNDSGASQGTYGQEQRQESNLDRYDSLPGRGTSHHHNHQTRGHPQRPQSLMQGTSSSDTRGSVVNHNHQTADYPQGAQGGCFPMPERKCQRKVIYQVVVTGKTLDTDKHLMNKVMDAVRNQVLFVENHDNHEITILFCPISSRVGTDVDAAFGHIKDDKPVILVVMHHEREPRTKSTSLRITCDKNVVLRVDVFYHDTMGLLTCEQNNTAVSEIQKKLLEFCTGIDNSRNSQGAAVESGRSDNKTSKSNWLPRIW